MYYKKKCAPCYVEHPVICATAAVFCVIGAVGVVMAVKKKAGRLARTAKSVGCACVQNVKEATEAVMDEGMNMMAHMMHKDASCGCGDTQKQS